MGRSPPPDPPPRQAQQIKPEVVQCGTGWLLLALEEVTAARVKHQRSPTHTVTPPFPAHPSIHDPLPYVPEEKGRVRRAEADDHRRAEP